MCSASTEVGGTVDKAECSSSKQGGLSYVFVKSSTLLLQRSELGVGAALFSAVMNSWKAAVMSVGEVEVGEASSSGFSSEIAGKSLEYSVLKLDFVSMLRI